MISYPNQKKYIINKKIEGDDVFFMLAWKDYCKASRDLTASGLKLYMYLAKNKDQYEFYFSPKDYCTTFGLSDKSYRNAKKELIKKGYLKEVEGNKVIFSTNCSFNPSIEQLKNRLLEIGEQIKINDIKIYNDFKKAILQEKLPEIKDEAVYRVKISNLISFGDDLLKQFARNEIGSII